MSEAKLDPGAARRRPVALIAVGYLCFLFALAEGFACVAVPLLQSRWMMYADPLVPADEHRVRYGEYLEQRDPELGWPSASEFGDTYAPDGSRWCKDSPTPGDAPWLVSLYGDSYTADWVGKDSDHWGCRLQGKLGRVVKNWGIGGYGTDQAYLRYRANEQDRAAVVVLGHMSDDMSRNLTRYRDFQGNSFSLSFKPRFVLDEQGELTHVPMPALDWDEYLRLLDLAEPRLRLPHEEFDPGGAAGAVRPEFPRTLALLRNFGFWRLQSRLAGLPFYGLFYRNDHPFRGVELTAAIMTRFAADALLRGQEPVLLLFPGRLDLEHFREHGEWIQQPLIDAIARKGHEAYHFGPAILAALDGRSAHAAFGTDDENARSHYNQDFSHLVADCTAELLAKRGLLGEVVQRVGAPSGRCFPSGTIAERIAARP